MSAESTYVAHLLADEPSGIGAGRLTVTADDDGEAHELIAQRNGNDMFDVWKTESTKIENGAATYELFEHNMPDPGEAFVVSAA